MDTTQLAMYMYEQCIHCSYMYIAQADMLLCACIRCIDFHLCT